MEGFVIRVGKWADKRESKLDYDVVSEANYVKLVRFGVTPSSWSSLFRDRNYGSDFWGGERTHLLVLFRFDTKIKNG